MRTKHKAHWEFTYSTQLKANTNRNKFYEENIPVNTKPYLDELDKAIEEDSYVCPEGKKIYKRRKETIERSFADSKQAHGFRYARFRGRNKVREQGLLTAACQNIKKLALAQWE